MLTEISRTKTNTVGSHLHAESEEAAFIETIEWWLLELGGRGIREMLTKGYKPATSRYRSLMDLMHSKVNIVNNTALHTSKMLGLTCSYQKKRNNYVM